MAKKDDKAKAAAKKARKADKQDKKSKKTTTKAAKKSKNDADSSDDEGADLDAVLADYAKKQEQFLAVTETTCEPPSARGSSTLLPNPQNERELLLFGGEFYDGSLARFYNELFIYNIHRDTWSSVTSPNSPLPRSGHAWCVHANSKTVYLSGGEFSSPKQGTFYHYSDFWQLHPSTREWTKIESKGKPPSARSGHRMVSWRQYIIVFGGFRDTSGGTTYLSDVFAFDTANNAWHALTAPAGNQRPDARSSFSFLPHEGGAVVYGGYSRVKTTAKGKSGASKIIEKPVVHSDAWFLRLTPGSSSADPPSMRWEKRKRPANAPNPPRAGATMASHRGRGIAFGGVWDTENSEEGIESEFYNQLGVWNVERNRFFQLSLRRPRAKKENAVERSSGRGARSKQGEEELLAKLRELEAKDNETEDGDATFDGSTQVAEEEEAAPVEKPVMWEMPHPRFNAQLAVQDDVVYIFGGTYEKGDREFTFDEMHAIDLGKLDGCKEIFRRELPDWGADEDQSEDEEDDEDDEADEEDEEDDKDDTTSEAPTLVTDTTTSETPLSPTSTLPEEEQRDEPSSLQDSLPHPRPFETLRAFFARTSQQWQEFLLEELNKGDGAANKSIKEVRKGAFERAEEKWWDSREDVQALEDEQEQAGIGEVVNLKDKAAAGAGTAGLGRRR